MTTTPTQTATTMAAMVVMATTCGMDPISLCVLCGSLVPGVCANPDPPHLRSLPPSCRSRIAAMVRALNPVAEVVWASYGKAGLAQLLDVQNEAELCTRWLPGRQLISLV